MDGRDRRRPRRDPAGGIAADPAIEGAAAACEVGLDGWRLLEMTDPAEAVAMAAVIQAAQRQRDISQRNLAVRIASATWGGRVE